MTRSRRLVLALAVLLQTGVSFSAGPMVFPFENRGGEPSHEWMGYGFAMMIEDMAGGVPLHDRLRLIGEMDLPEGMPLTLATRIQVARMGGAGQLITGSFEVIDDMVRAEVQIFQLDGLVRTTDSFTVPVSELPNGICDAFARQYGWSAVYPSDLKSRTFERYVKGTLSAAFYGRFDDLQTLAAEHTFPVLAMRLGEMLFHEGSYEAAMDALLTGHDADADRLYLAGMAGIRSGQFDRALTCFLRALQGGADARSLINAAGCLLMQDKLDEADVVLAAVDTGGTDVPVRFNRAVLQAVRGKQYEALLTLKTFVSGGRMTRDAHKLVLYCCGKLTADQHTDLCVVVEGAEDGVLDDAEVKNLYRFAAFEKSGDPQPDIGSLKSFYLSAGRRNVADGNPREAEENLRKVLYMDPVHREALQLMCDACNDPLSCEILKRIREQVNGIPPKASKDQKN